MKKNKGLIDVKLYQISDSQERIKCKQTHQKSFIQTCITVNYLKKNDPQNRYRFNKSCQIPIYKKIHKLIRLNFSIYKQYWKKQQSKKKIVETKSIFSQISFNSLNIKFVLNRNLNYIQLEELSFNLQYFYEDNSLEDENYEFEQSYNQLEVTLYSPQYITQEKSQDFFLNFQKDIPFNLFICDIDESKGLNEEDDKKEDEDDKKEDEAEKCISQIE